ncbi:hypothetical protein N7450_011691 [Penicillium hetheringtonii]|uniref:Uncharacterized protein n=1 Tax=Penicillium hetheringtonii TaxID=911720 RepID=A0AAD6DBC6_9EURO|nr:hypothetical protein N7450_011691 [Penicillium hetheringtonii]
MGTSNVFSNRNRHRQESHYREGRGDTGYLRCGNILDASGRQGHVGTAATAIDETLQTTDKVQVQVGSMNRCTSGTRQANRSSMPSFEQPGTPRHMAQRSDYNGYQVTLSYLGMKLWTSSPKRQHPGQDTRSIP